MTIETILEHIEFDTNGGCWLWNRYLSGTGYGYVRTEGRNPRGAHRVAWEAVHGPIPDGLMVCHRCDVPACCNPGHLFLGTCADNLADMAAKDRHGQSKLTAAQVREVRDRLCRREPHKRIAQDFGVSRQAIGDISTGKRRAAIR